MVFLSKISFAKVLNLSGNSSFADSKTEFFSLALQELEKKRDLLKKEIDNLEQRKKQIDEELSVSFLGKSDSIARRVKGFQDYLTGALQGLVQSAEKLDLVIQPLEVKPSPLDKEQAVKKNENIENIMTKQGKQRTSHVPPHPVPLMPAVPLGWPRRTPVGMNCSGGPRSAPGVACNGIIHEADVHHPVRL